MRHDTRDSMKVIASALRHAWNQGAISGPGMELVLLAAASAMDRDAFAEACSPELLEVMDDLYERVRDTYVVPPAGGPSVGPMQGRAALGVPMRLADGIGALLARA